MTYTPSEVWSGQRVPPPRSPPWQGGVLLARLWPRMFRRGCQGGSRTRSALFQGQLSVPIRSAWQWDSECRRVESNHQGLSTTDLQSAEPTALLNAGLVLALSEEPFPSEAREGDESKWKPTGIAPASPACRAGALLLSYGPEWCLHGASSCCRAKRRNRASRSGPSGGCTRASAVRVRRSSLDPMGPNRACTERAHDAAPSAASWRVEVEPRGVAPRLRGCRLRVILFHHGPWRSPRELNSVLLVFSQPCNR